MTRLTSCLLLAALVLVVAGCEADTVVSPDRSASLRGGDDRAADLTRAAPHAQAESAAMLAGFNPFAGELPEGIVVDARGYIYVSMTSFGEIWKLDPDGTFEEVVASFPVNPGDFGTVGMAIDAQGVLYVAILSSLEASHGVWSIARDGATERLAGTGEIVWPNAIAISPRGTLYITDSVLGAVWRYEESGPAEVWIQDETLEGLNISGIDIPVGANGIAFTRRRASSRADAAGPPSVGSVLVANLEKGQLVDIPILPDGSAGAPEILVADPATLYGIDGIATDAHGTIWGVNFFSSTLLRISREGDAMMPVVTGSPLDFPASLAFGSGRDRHALFITNFSFGHFLSDPPMPENAAPGVVRVDVGPPGRTH